MGEKRVEKVLKGKRLGWGGWRLEINLGRGMMGQAKWKGSLKEGRALVWGVLWSG